MPYENLVLNVKHSHYKATFLHFSVGISLNFSGFGKKLANLLTSTSYTQKCDCMYC